MIFNGTGQGEMSNYWWILSSAVALKFSFLCLFCSYNTLLCVILLFSSFLRLYCISDSLSRFQSMLSKFTLHTNVELVYEEHSVDVNWAHNECRISVWGGTKYIFHSAIELVHGCILINYVLPGFLCLDQAFGANIGWNTCWSDLV